MEPKPRKNKLIWIVVAIVIILALAARWYVWQSHQTVWVPYHENTYGFDIKYPQGWVTEDSLSRIACCLFIVNVHTATSTVLNASGTPVTSVTMTEPIKLQIGYYYKTPSYDPFKMSTTTAIALGKNTAYTGISNGTLYYLIPTSDLDGIGAAVFTALDNTDTAGTKKAVESILSTIVFTGTSTATTTGR